MKHLVLTLAVLPALVSAEPLRYKLPDHLVPVLAQPVSVGQPVPPLGFTPFLGYSWSLSGEQYTESRAEIDRLASWASLDAVLGLRVRDNTPAPGIGASAIYSRDRWSLSVTASVLFPQASRPDLTLGAALGVRF